MRKQPPDATVPPASSIRPHGCRYYVTVSACLVVLGLLYAL